MDSEDSFDEEYLDDPITLFEESDTDQQSYNKGGYKSSSRSSFVPVTFFDITSNVKLLKECRPLYIKVVDCDKHPWYYRKFYKKYNIVDRFDRKENMSTFYGVDDRVTIDEPIYTVSIDDSESETIDNDTHKVPSNMWLLQKNTKVQYSLKRITSTKSILTINRNKSSNKKRKKKKLDIGFKKNKGLKGLKITETKNVTDLDIESRMNTNEIDFNQNEHERFDHNKKLHTYISDVDKALKQLNTIMFPIAEFKDDIHNDGNKNIDKAQSPFFSSKKADKSPSQSKVYCNDDKTMERTQSLFLSTDRMKNFQEPIDLPQDTLYSKDNERFGETQSIFKDTNKKSHSPIFPCKPPYNKSIYTNKSHTSLGSSLGQLESLPDNSFKPTVAGILKDLLAYKATETISTQDITIHTQARAQKNVKPFQGNEMQKGSLNSIKTNSRNFEFTALSKSASQCTVSKPSVQTTACSSPMTTCKFITHDNKQNDVNNHSQHLSNGTKINAKQFQNKRPYNYYVNNTLQYNCNCYNTLHNNSMNNTNIYPTICPVHKTSIERNYSLTQSYKNSLTSPPFSKRNHNEENFKYLNYMSLVVGMHRNHAPIKSSNTSQVPSPEVTQMHYSKPPPAYQMTDYYRFRPTFTNTSQHLNFNYPPTLTDHNVNFRTPHFYYQTTLSQHPPSPLLQPSPYPYVPPTQNIQGPNFSQIVSPTFLGNKPSKAVHETRTNVKKLKKSKKRVQKELQVVTDSAKMLNIDKYGTNILHEYSSKDVKQLNEEMSLIKSSTSLNQTIVESKVDMLKELEKEMMNIHGEVYNTHDNTSKTPLHSGKAVDENRNKRKCDNVAAKQTLYARQNNVFDVPFKLQETVINHRHAPFVDSTIKNKSDGLIPENNLKRVSSHKPLGLQNTSMSPVSKKSRVVNNTVLGRKQTSVNLQTINNAPKLSNYSPPILPIPSYDKTLEILTRATLEAKKYLDEQRCINRKNKCTESVDKANVCTIHFANDNDKQNKGKKISLEEYKNRKLYEPTVNNNNKCVVDNNMSSYRKKNLGDISRISDLDQGYGSDSTVII